MPDLITPQTSLLIARVIIGGIFLYYGLPKIKDLKSNAKDFEAMGFKPGFLWGTPIALLESIGSLLLVAGILGQLIAGLFAIHMATGTIWKITKTKKPFTDYSYDIILFAISLVIFTHGTGSFTLFSFGF